MDTNQYMGIFLEEAREHLMTLNTSLLELEKEPDNSAILDEIFRCAHTIKGMSATMGFTAMAELTHNMENVLDRLRKGVLTADEEILDILFQCVDTLEQQIENIAAGGDNEPNVTALIAKLVALAKQSAVSPTTNNTLSKPPKITDFNETEANLVEAAKRNDMNVYQVDVYLREGCLLKAARAYLVMSTLENHGEVIKCVPSTEDLEKENFENYFTVVLVTDANQETIKRAVESIAEIESVVVVPVDNDGPTEMPLGIEQSAVNAGQPINNTESANGNGQNQHKKIRTSQSVRVDIEKLDTLLNLVGELVINKTRLAQIGMTHKLTDLIETIEQLDRITTDLQSVVMKVRMVPIGQVFNRFPRMVRDLAHELQKEVNFIIEGEETELDRTVIDEIGDPLVHLLRNAVDHGLEQPDERKRAGKNPVGQVRLLARHEGNNVIILVEDDGRGIDPAIVKQKALDKGLITQEQFDKMADEEAIHLIFLPGFSTSETVTDISGRGVGMDAVKTKIEALGGMVDIETKLGEGSRFKIRLPLTLAIIQALLIKLCDEIYAIPLSSIDSTICVLPSDIKTIKNHETILLRGEIIPLIRLGERLNVPGAQHQLDGELYVVIVHVGEHKAGLIVDELIGQQEIVIKSLGKLLAGIRGIAGATILGNGEVALILDVGALM